MHLQVQILTRQFEAETQPFRKVHRMIDLFEVLIKSHTVVIMAEYFAHANISDTAKGLLAQGLRTPSLGTWQLFSRVLFQELAAMEHQWHLLPMFPEEFSALDKALNADKTNIIAFRNGYAHGATPADEKCTADVKKYVPFLQKLLNSKWLAESVAAVDDNKVWLRSSTGSLCLHPLLVAKEKDAAAPLAFYNDLKNDKIGLLNYPLSKHYREKEFYAEFHQYLPLQEWKKAGNNEFFQRIEELTETFKGRLPEREQLLQFVRDNNKGYCSIQGNPGIGKSALIAQFFKDLQAHKEFADVRVIEYFIRRGTHQAQIEYLLTNLIKHTDELFAAGKEIRAEGKTIFDLQHQLFSKWRAWGEQVNGQKLLILIDGLDEGVENDIVSYLPRENFDNIIIIYGSRPGGHKSIDELWGTLPAEHHTKTELSGLSKEDIRALIYEVANKYEVDRESSWIDAVQQRSQGNPLYLKLLCDAIEQGSIGINDINALPDKIDDYYKAILNRYANDATDGDALLGGLFVFAAAKDYLTMAHLGLINGLGHATLQRIGSTLKEVLHENPLTESVLDYQLFHESFREYLLKEKAMQVRDAAERIIDFCGQWRQYEGTWEQRYTLEYWANHLAESKKLHRSEQLIQLIYDQKYQATQKKGLRSFDASNNLLKIALLKASELHRDDDALRAALFLVDIKYEQANDAPQIIAMVANNEIELALKRIEAFGGADTESKKRQFILYMLCLMELTLLGSKDKPHKKTAIIKLLHHFDEHIPTDHSLINWNDFFPSYLMFLMACECADIEVDYLLIFKRTKVFDSKWIGNKGAYSNVQFVVLIECVRSINHEYKSSALWGISTELAKQGRIVEALECALGINDVNYKKFAFGDISTELAKQGRIEEAFECVRGINDVDYKSSAFMKISTELAKQGWVEKAATALQEALECVRSINHEYKSSAFREICTELAKQGRIEEALAIAQKISDRYEKCMLLQGISSELVMQNNLEVAAIYIQKAMECAMEISNGWERNVVLGEIAIELLKQSKIEEGLQLACTIKFDKNIDKTRNEISLSYQLIINSIKLAKQGRFDEAVECAKRIHFEFDKSEALSKIATEFTKQNEISKAEILIKEALECARGISDTRLKDRFGKGDALMLISSELQKQGKNKDAAFVTEEAISYARGLSEISISSEMLGRISLGLAEQGKVEEAVKCALRISDEVERNRTFSEMYTELAMQGNIEEAGFVLQGVLESTNSINVGSTRIYDLVIISLELAKLGKMEASLQCVQEISIGFDKVDALCLISKELEKQNKIEESTIALQEALKCARSMKNETDKGIALSVLSTEFAKQGKLEEALSAIRDAHDCASYVLNNSYSGNFEILSVLSAELAEQGQLQEALGCAKEININWRACSALCVIIDIMVKQGKVEEATIAMREAMAFAQEIKNEGFKSDAFIEISTELAKQGKVQEALECFRHIGKYGKSKALKKISTALAKQGKIEAAFERAREIEDKRNKSLAFCELSIALAQQGKIESAIELARGIDDESIKSRALLDISIEVVLSGNMSSAESIALEIPELQQRYSCWEAFASNLMVISTPVLVLKNGNMLKNEEARLFYRKGWCKWLKVMQTDAAVLQAALPQLANDIKTLETLLQKYALHLLVFDKPNLDMQHLLNRTLDIQWMIDIVARFPQNKITNKTYTNINNWIGSIADEDNREQIQLWAKQVAKGRLTEAEFQQKMVDM